MSTFLIPTMPAPAPLSMPDSPFHLSPSCCPLWLAENSLNPEVESLIPNIQAAPPD